MNKLILIALILTTQAVHAYNLNGKHWAEKRCTIILTAALDDPKLVKRMKLIAYQIRKNVPFKVRVIVREPGAYIATL